MEFEKRIFVNPIKIFAKIETQPDGNNFWKLADKTTRKSAESSKKC